MAGLDYLDGVIARSPPKLQNKKSCVFNFRMMTIKEQLLQELDQVPESTLHRVLEFVRSLKAEQQSNSENRVWQAYLDSEREREEVYRRLANS
ncbi:hypothetical protein [Scytonema sp. PCC 10023]|uniref:hypothetical protein n=1 Tax=Scytonema sp. PCC 10023 TaxID=1680591 RepID=UPI0039C604C1